MYHRLEVVLLLDVEFGRLGAHVFFGDFACLARSSLALERAEFGSAARVVERDKYEAHLLRPSERFARFGPMHSPQARTRCWWEERQPFLEISDETAGERRWGAKTRNDESHANGLASERCQVVARRSGLVIELGFSSGRTAKHAQMHTADSSLQISSAVQLNLPTTSKSIRSVRRLCN